MVSVNTNAGALLALREYNAAGGLASSVAQRVSTGLRVSSALDNASIFSIAQGLRSEVDAWDVVAKGLRSSAGIVGVAVSAATGISDILAEIKSKVIDYHAADTAGKQIIQNDVTALVAAVDLLADGATFNGTNLIDRDQTTVATTPPPDEGTNFQFVGTGSNVHTIGTTPGTLTVTWSRTGSGGGVLQLQYGGSPIASASHSPGKTSGSFNAHFDAASGTDVTFNRNGAGGVTLDYSFQFVPDISSGITGEFTVPRDHRGNTIDLQYRSLRSDGIGIDGLDLSTLDAAGTLAQIDAASLEVNQNLAYYGAKRREMDTAIRAAEAFRDVLNENIGNLVDSDLGRDSAKMVANQVRQDLAQQALSIANQRSSIILDLLDPVSFGSQIEEG